ncbi:hypothetical protein GE061_001437 [Apolygus lucorum]|uniref:Uncharacterized protein n=1 Tax=Apolygus lucorum TaxID=248454 RepID=A0A8S9Y8F6_APOLU|nr:hypothetical protein GE061_001437 [Apolygus lucorum]
MEKWTKKNMESRAAWKCLLSPAARTSDTSHRATRVVFKADFRSEVDVDDIQMLNNELTVAKSEIDMLKLENESLQALRLEIDQLRVRNLDLENKVAELTIPPSGLSVPRYQSIRTLREETTDDMLPKYIETEISKVPKLYTDNPTSVISFLEKVHLLNEMNGSCFKQIFKRIATCQQNSIMLRLASGNDLTFQKLAETLLEELTTPQTKLNLVQSKILRPQGDSENFRAYVEDVTKFNQILSQYSEIDLIKSILQETNLTTRAKFHFSTRPQNSAELQSLVAEVEKLELNENLKKSRANYFRRFPEQLNQKEETPSGERPQKKFWNKPDKHKSDMSKNNTAKSGDVKNISDDKTKKNSKNSNFRQNNPNFNKSFRQNFFHPMQFQPFSPCGYPAQPLTPWMGYHQLNTMGYPAPPGGPAGFQYQPLALKSDGTPSNLDFQRPSSPASSTSSSGSSTKGAKGPKPKGKNAKNSKN